MAGGMSYRLERIAGQLGEGRRGGVHLAASGSRVLKKKGGGGV